MDKFTFKNLATGAMIEVEALNYNQAMDQALEIAKQQNGGRPAGIRQVGFQVSGKSSRLGEDKINLQLDIENGQKFHLVTKDNADADPALVMYRGKYPTGYRFTALRGMGVEFFLQPDEIASLTPVVNEADELLPSPEGE